MIGNGAGNGGGNGAGNRTVSAAPPARLPTPDRAGDLRPRRPRDPVPAHAGESSVTIDVLRMRVQAPNATAGRSIVEEAVQQVADRLPAGLTGRIPGIKLRVRPRRPGTSGLRDAIADSMLEMLTLRGRGER